MQPPVVTVVVPTYRRPTGLARCLAALAGEEAPFTWDVVVVDNDGAAGEAERSAARGVVQGFAFARPDVPIRLETEAVQGAAHARNRGIAEARGEVIAMLDDDVVPCPGWLEAVCRPVVAGEAAGAGGKVVLDPGAPRPEWLDDTAVGGYLTAHDLGPDPHDLDYFAELVVTANAAFRRDVLLQIGGFDPAFGPRGRVQIVADDARLTRQVIGLGERVRWCPDAVVVHDLPAARTRLRWLLKRAWWQGRSDWRLERLDLLDRRFGGAWAGVVQIVGWLGTEMRARAAEGLRRPPIAVHALCDVIRMAGRFTELIVELIERTPTAPALSGPTPAPDTSEET